MAKKTQRAGGVNAERVRSLARDRKRRQRDRMRDGMSRAESREAAAMPVASGRKAGKPDARRVASRGKRDRFSAATWGGRLANSDPTLVKFSGGRGVGLWTLILHQFANVAGWCRAWVDHVLVTDRVIKAKKIEGGENAEARQKIANDAATRAMAAWNRTPNRHIVMQKLLMGRFYGFARAEVVPQFDDVLGEWVPVLYDVPQEAWLFDDDGRDFLVTSEHPSGIEVDPKKFVHFQWGSADTKYGEGDLSPVYLALWKIQKLETMLLERVEDNESVVIVHVPTSLQPEEVADLETAYSEEFRKVIRVPAPNEQVVRTELPTLNVTTSGAAGRQEKDIITMYERWIQTHLLGAPQTGDRSLGTGKLEDVRQDVWNDKTPLGSSALDQCLTAGWIRAYCLWNLADVPPDLWPRFESDTTEITAGLSGAAAEEVRATALDLVAERIPSIVAIEQWGSLGIPRQRAKEMAEACIAERPSLAVAAPVGSVEIPPTAPPDKPDNDEPSDDGDQEAA